MRRILFIIGLLSVFSANANADVKACIQKKFTAVKQVTTGNVGSMFMQHFDQESLVVAAAGGAVAWKKLSETEKDVERNKLSDAHRLKKLAESFSDYKTAELTKVTSAGAKAILIVKTHKGNKTITLFFGQGCKITRMCTGGICVHDLF